jgi:hypothetical protein
VAAVQLWIPFDTLEPADRAAALGKSVTLALALHPATGKPLHLRSRCFGDGLVGVDPLN